MSKPNGYANLCTLAPLGSGDVKATRNAAGQTSILFHDEHGRSTGYVITDDDGLDRLAAAVEDARRMRAKALASARYVVDGTGGVSFADLAEANSDAPDFVSAVARLSVGDVMQWGGGADASCEVRRIA